MSLMEFRRREEKALDCHREKTKKRKTKTKRQNQKKKKETVNTHGVFFLYFLFVNVDGVEGYERCAQGTVSMEVSDDRRISKACKTGLSERKYLILIVYVCVIVLIELWLVRVLLQSTGCEVHTYALASVPYYK